MLTAGNRSQHSTVTSTGFTLVELVLTILIAAILAIGVVAFIGDSVQGLVVARNQNQLASSGQAVIERLAVELYNSVPNSIRIAPIGTGDQCLEYLPFTHASAYIDPPFSTAASTFDVIVTDPGVVPLPSGIQSRRYVALYPIQTDELYTLAGVGPIAQVSAIAAVPGSAGRARLTLTDAHQFSRRSPLERWFLTESPVSFCVEGTRLYRYADYGLHPLQCLPATCLAAGARGLLANNLDNAALSAFRFLPGTLQRNGLVQFNLAFRQGDAVLTLQHELLLRNVP